MCISISSSLSLVNETNERRRRGRRKKKKCMRLMNLALLEWFTDALKQIVNAHSLLIRLCSDTEHWRCWRIFVIFEKKNILIICHNHLMKFFSSLHEAIHISWSNNENERPITVCCVWIVNLNCCSFFFFFFRIEKAGNSYANLFQMNDWVWSWSMKVMRFILW